MTPLDTLILTEWQAKREQGIPANQRLADFDPEMERISYDQQQLDETDYKVVQWLVSEVMTAKAVTSAERE